MGETYWATTAFGQTIAKYGPLAAVATVAALAVIVLFFLRQKAKIDIMRSRAAADQQAQVQEQQRRERESAAIVQGLNAMKDSQVMIMTNHLEHDRQEREAILKAIERNEAKEEATVQAIREMTNELRRQREAQDARDKELTKKLEEIHRAAAVGQKKEGA